MTTLKAILRVSIISCMILSTKAQADENKFSNLEFNSRAKLMQQLEGDAIAAYGGEDVRELSPWYQHSEKQKCKDTECYEELIWYHFYGASHYALEAKREAPELFQTIARHCKSTKVGERLECFANKMNAASGILGKISKDQADIKDLKEKYSGDAFAQDLVALKPKAESLLASADKGKEFLSKALTQYTRTTYLLGSLCQQNYRSKAACNELNTNASKQLWPTFGDEKQLAEYRGKPIGGTASAGAGGDGNKGTGKEDGAAPLLKGEQANKASSARQGDKSGDENGRAGGSIHGAADGALGGSFTGEACAKGKNCDRAPLLEEASELFGDVVFNCPGWLESCASDKTAANQKSDERFKNDKFYTQLREVRCREALSGFFDHASNNLLTAKNFSIFPEQYAEYQKIKNDPLPQTALAQRSDTDKETPGCRIYRKLSEAAKQKGVPLAATLPQIRIESVPTSLGNSAPNSQNPFEKLRAAAFNTLKNTFYADVAKYEASQRAMALYAIAIGSGQAGLGNNGTRSLLKESFAGCVNPKQKGRSSDLELSSDLGAFLNPALERELGELDQAIPESNRQPMAEAFYNSMVRKSKLIDQLDHGSYDLDLVIDQSCYQKKENALNDVTVSFTSDSVDDNTLRLAHFRRVGQALSESGIKDASAENFLKPEFDLTKYTPRCSELRALRSLMHQAKNQILTQYPLLEESTVEAQNRGSPLNYGYNWGCQTVGMPAHFIYDRLEKHVKGSDCTHSGKLRDALAQEASSGYQPYRKTFDNAMKSYLLRGINRVSNVCVDSIGEGMRAAALENVLQSYMSCHDLDLEDKNGAEVCRQRRSYSSVACLHLGNDIAKKQAEKLKLELAQTGLIAAATIAAVASGGTASGLLTITPTLAGLLAPTIGLATTLGSVAIEYKQLQATQQMADVTRDSFLNQLGASFDQYDAATRQADKANESFYAWQAFNLALSVVDLAAIKGVIQDVKAARLAKGAAAAKTTLTSDSLAALIADIKSGKIKLKPKRALASLHEALPPELLTELKTLEHEAGSAKQIESALRAKGLTPQESEIFLTKLFVGDVKSPEVALKLIEGIDPKRFKTPHAKIVLPYTVRKIVNFKGVGALANDEIKAMLNEWSDLELAGAAKIYDRAAVLARDAKTEAEQIDAFEKALAEEGVPREAAKQMRACFFSKK